ncbi:hypothetical protein COEREDRAFT_81726 [Coemansia reversa NRRL 1564]|uniref:PAS domain-containing protein n=1 Tax=Coemansia reversa (strain ATCC 12441 / NRRL 1564) TaxID=763665 RepID=A0A2G5B9U4_COERN|nr:hypothetical protein COEREDRAFT_81726 [Coemansia reversa NRRL 1564]|eukprot:PIA15785.1 hypothetical protein COEREDRAFT_81726 [Coemansia reversa NRRL 1564]
MASQSLSEQQLSQHLRTSCICSERLAARCHLRSYGVLMVSEHDEIMHADPEAVEALRGPAEEWEGSCVHTLHDSTFNGSLHKYWSFIERLSVKGRNGGDTHNYLVVRRAEDDAVSWIQVCIHAVRTAEEGEQPLYMWNLRDVSGATRCLEMSRLDAETSYLLSLEDDGLPHSRLLTRAPGVCHPSNRSLRNQLAQLFETAVASEGFGVLYLTSFGAVDTVFPRRVLGWDESELLDRSFVGMLCPEDRTFFCSALRRSYHDGIPQRLVLKLAVASENDTQSDNDSYLSCDVTILMPETVQQPVLIVRASELLKSHATAAADSCALQVQNIVPREQLDNASVSAALAHSASLLLSCPVPAKFSAETDVQGFLSLMTLSGIEKQTRGAAVQSHLSAKALCVSANSTPPLSSLSELRISHASPPLNLPSLPTWPLSSSCANDSCSSVALVTCDSQQTESGSIEIDKNSAGEAVEDGLCNTFGETLAPANDVESNDLLASKFICTETNSKAPSVLQSDMKGTQVEIPMCEIFNNVGKLPPLITVAGQSKAQAYQSIETVHGQFNNIGSTFFAMLEKIGATVPNSSSLHTTHDVTEKY